MLKIINENIIEGIVPPSDCERNLNVKWLTGTPTGSFYIGDKEQEKKIISQFLNGKTVCKVDSKSFFNYLDEIDEIVKKFKHMFYGPVDILTHNRKHFENLSEKDRCIYISYTYPDRYLKTSKFDFNVREFKYSLAANITNVKFEKSQDGDYVVFVNLVENWRDVIMAKASKCNNKSITTIFNDFIKAGLDNGKNIIDLARLFGIKYANLILNNEIDMETVLENSNYSNESLLEYIKNGMILSSDILWESKHNEGEVPNNVQNTLQTFDFLNSPIKDGKNIVVYGTPGCGKSYYVQHVLLRKYSTSNCIRTTFFQDYTNTDFIGQILPVIEEEKVTYRFNPGPFTLALEKAIRKPNERVALVIEELNRGSAASIFGDIFQLLDRKEGVSEYEIKNVSIINYLKEKFEGVYTFENIKLPGNLSIYATMNTSDQNVFTLDTAFKRRWKFEKLSNDFDDYRKIYGEEHPFKDDLIPGMLETWKNFVETINDAILNEANITKSEDKQLGIFFVDKNGLVEQGNVDPHDKKKVKEFAYKIFEYLWDDVLKYCRENWFGKEIKSLDDLIKEYIEKADKNEGAEVFVNGIFKENK